MMTDAELIAGWHRFDPFLVSAVERDLIDRLEAANADAQELADALYSQPLTNLKAGDRRALARHEKRVHP